MWLKLALNLILVVLISACSSPDRHVVDKLNSISYAYHYRDIDSTEVYARRAYELSTADDGKAEALNNLAFVFIAFLDRAKIDRVSHVLRLAQDHFDRFAVPIIRAGQICSVLKGSLF